MQIDLTNINQRPAQEVSQPPKFLQIGARQYLFSRTQRIRLKSQQQPADLSRTGLPTENKKKGVTKHFSMITLKKPQKQYFFPDVKQNLESRDIVDLLNQVHQMVTVVEPIPLPKMIKLGEPKFPKTIAIDLDETLLHSESYRRGVKYDFVIRSGLVQVGVHVRPYCQHFLEELSKLSELVLFTASTEKYATLLLLNIDPKNKYFAHKLYKQHCTTLQNGSTIKNLSILEGRSPKNTVLIDNGPNNFYAQPLNGIPIIPFTDNKQDQQLLDLLQFLKSNIITSLNVQVAIQNYFQFNLFRSFSNGVQAFKILYDSL